MIEIAIALIIGLFIGAFFLWPYIQPQALRNLLMALKKPGDLILLLRRSGEASLISAERIAPNALLNKKQGVFIETRGSMYRFGKSKIGVASEEIGFTINPQYAKAVETMRSEGIANMPDAIKSPVEIGPTGEPTQVQGEPVRGETIRFEDIRYFQETDMNPSQVWSIIEHALAEKGGKGFSIDFKVFLGIAMVLIAIGIMIQIIQGGGLFHF